MQCKMKIFFLKTNNLVILKEYLNNFSLRPMLIQTKAFSGDFFVFSPSSIRAV